MFHKPTADIFIDDKGVNVFDWIRTQPPRKGIIAGAFDVIHPGYVRMFADAKKRCNHLTVAIHVDPSTENLTNLNQYTLQKNVKRFFLHCEMLMTLYSIGLKMNTLEC